MSDNREASSQEEEDKFAHQSDGGNDNVEDSNIASDEDDCDDDDLGEIDRYWPPPVEVSVHLTGSQASKTVSAFAFNNSGTRFVAGGYDQQVQIWDFDALDEDRPAPICSTQPCGQALIKQLEFSMDDELILVVPTNCQAIVMASDGIVNTKNQCVKGDQYLSDMANTKGHVNSLNDGCWNPKDKGTFITCSLDSTVRVWDLTNLSQQKTVIKTRSPVSGHKAVPTACRYSRDALSIAAGCNDGTISMWDTRRKFISTSACIRNAHFKGSEITGIEFAYGLNKICTRSEDGSCKIWDLRQLKQATATRNGLNTMHGSECCFSPDDKLVVVGTSSTNEDPGQVLFLDSNDLTTKSSIELAGASVIRGRWQPKINHIGYSCSEGSVYVTYDKRRSIGGFLADPAAKSRGVKRKKYISQRDNFSASSIKKIITPHALPLFRDDQSTQSFAKIRQDPKRSYKPEMPISGASQGGRVIPAGSTLSSYIAKNIAKPIDDGSMNIRDRILRHAEEAERDPKWVGGAQANQPRDSVDKDQQ